jgi:uncharacterized protein DUF1579
MRFSTAPLAIVAASLLPAVTASAQAPAPPKPAPEMAQLKFFEGRWTCAGEVQATPMGPAGKMTATVKIEDDLGGFWQSGNVKGMAPGMPPMEGKFHTTWDPGAKSYVMFWVDSMGGWSRSTAPGWTGEKLVYTGEGAIAGQKFAGRDTFTRNADGSLRHTWEMQIEGKWMPVGDETCHPAPKPDKKKK